MALPPSPSKARSGASSEAAWRAPSDAPFAETHRRVWTALDSLAEARDLSPSALAKIAGLDATAFNPSKRVGRDGRLRWPSVETLAKVLAVTGEDFQNLSRLLDAPSAARRAESGTVPVRRLDASGALAPGDALSAPPALDAPVDGDAFWLEIGDDAPGAAPVFRTGARLWVSPGAPHDPGARLAIGRADGAARLGELQARDATGLTLAPLLGPAAGPAERYAYADLAWTGRILWASQ